MNIENNEPYVPHAPEAASRMTTRKGIAVAALITGILAFFIGWVPFFGLVAGIVAVILGVVALLKKQSKAQSITAVSLGGLAAITSVAITIVALSTTDWENIERDAASSTAQTSPEKKNAPEIEHSDKPAASKKPKPEPEPTKKVEPEPSKNPAISEEPTPQPSSKETSEGLTSGMASIACERALNQVVPGEVKFHWLGGTIAERLEDDAWFLKVQFTPKGLERMVMECIVTGSESAPQVLALDVY